MRRRLLRFGIGVLVLCLYAGVLGYFRGCCTYSFGIRESAYAQYFSEAGALNRVSKHDRERSWLTTIPAGTATFEIEHLTVATEEDRSHLNLPAGEYLFSSISVRDGVEIVELTHTYDGQPLEIVGTFVYRAATEGDVAWHVSRLADEPAVPNPPYGYVRIYKSPTGPLRFNLLPRPFWFGDGMTETLRVKAGDEIHDFTFALEWHESSSIWWQIFTIT